MVNLCLVGVTPFTYRLIFIFPLLPLIIAILSVIQIGSSNNPLRDLFVVRCVPTPTRALVGFGGIYHVQISYDFLIIWSAYVYGFIMLFGVRAASLRGAWLGSMSSEWAENYI